jgi:hypothetical protein
LPRRLTTDGDAPRACNKREPFAICRDKRWDRQHREERSHGAVSGDCPVVRNNAKSYLTSAKQLMRRIRDKVPYSEGDRMMLGGGGGWMVEGSPPRLLRDYNQLIESYNRGVTI